jgi:hypothetical protein
MIFDCTILGGGLEGLNVAWRYAGGIPANCLRRGAAISIDSLKDQDRLCSDLIGTWNT